MSQSNRKTFVFVYERSGKLCASLKCQPMPPDFLRSMLPGVVPAYPMNTKHWNTVYINKISAKEPIHMLEHSYKLTKDSKAQKSL